MSTHFTNEGTEAQRGFVTGPSSHGFQMAEVGFKHEQIDPGTWAFNYNIGQ